MKTHAHAVINLESLKSHLDSSGIQAEAVAAKSILVQIYSSQTKPGWMRQVSQAILERLPAAVVVGATTDSTVGQQLTCESSTVISLSFFSATSLTPVVLRFEEGNEWQNGNHLRNAIGASSAMPAGILFLTTPLGNDAYRILNMLKDEVGDIVVVGGSVANNADVGESQVLLGKHILYRGLVAVLLTSHESHISNTEHLGWHALSSAMNAAPCLHDRYHAHIENVPHRRRQQPLRNRGEQRRIARQQGHLPTRRSTP